MPKHHLVVPFGVFSITTFQFVQFQGWWKRTLFCWWLVELESPASTIFGWCLIRRCVAIFGVMEWYCSWHDAKWPTDQVKQTRSRTLGQRLRYCNSCSMRADSKHLQHQAQTLQGCSSVMCYWDSRENLCIFKIKWLMLIHVGSMQHSGAVILIYIWFELQISRQKNPLLSPLQRVLMRESKLFKLGCAAPQIKPGIYLCSDRCHVSAICLSRKRDEHADRSLQCLCI